MSIIIYTIHVEIFPRDLISRLAMRDNAVCAWVTNTPVAKARGTRNINVASADHLHTFIRRENIWYYVIKHS